MIQKDPVCGMEIDPKTAAGKSEYEGKTYYFCSSGCKKLFDKNPAKYVIESDTCQIETEHQHQH
jgi:YHS domain-containing protein